MIWVTLRQHRAQFLAGLGLCILLLLVLLWTGLGLHSTYDSLGIGSCLKAVPARDCSNLERQLSVQYSGLQFFYPLCLLFPALLGIFWGAPLIAREVELGTNRLAWTQSVSRTRWILTKVVILCAAAVGLAAAFAAALWWWIDPLASGYQSGRFGFGVFDLQGIAPVAYTLFAVALGVAIGVVLQRTAAAMVATLVGFAGIRLAVELLLRPYYQPAVNGSYSFFSKGVTQGPPDGSWILTDDTVTASGISVSAGGGHGFSSDLLQKVCPTVNGVAGSGGPSDTQMNQCVLQQGIHYIATYQPPDRFWLFQGVEAGLFITLAIALCGFSIWWVNRRVR
jgi:hypothetical protein